MVNEGLRLVSIVFKAIQCPSSFYIASDPGHCQKKKSWILIYSFYQYIFFYQEMVKKGGALNGPGKAVLKTSVHLIWTRALLSAFI
jgi:hypothetical protein